MDPRYPDYNSMANGRPADGGAADGAEREPPEQLGDSSDEDGRQADGTEDEDEDEEEEVEEYLDEGRPDDTAELARRAAALPAKMQPVYRLLQVLMAPENHVHNWPFMNAVDSNSSTLWDYDTVVTTPMWLKKIREKLLLLEYESPTEVFADLRLMLRNCYRYNGPQHSVTRRALRLEHMMEQLIEQLEPELRQQCTLEASEGADAVVDPKIVNRRRSVRNKAPGFFSHVLHWVRHERADREKEFRRQQLETRRQQRREKEDSIVAWEERLLQGQTGDWLKAMWELPQMAQFIHLSLRALNIFEVPLYELERMLLVPQSSETLAMLMTSLVSGPLIRTKLSEMPPMPYTMWTEKLAARVQLWYRAYVKEAGQTDRLLDTQGIEPDFWRVVGTTNPFEDKLFHELSFYQRVWMVKTMCDFLFHNHKTVQDCVMESSMTEPRESLLGVDRHGYEYIHLPHLFVQDVRLYRRRPWRAPDHWRAEPPAPPPPPPPLRASQLGPAWTRARLEKFRRQLTQLRGGSGRRGGARKTAVRRVFTCLGGSATPAASPCHSDTELSESTPGSSGQSDADDGPEFTLTRSGRKSQRPPRSASRRSSSAAAAAAPSTPEPTPSRRGGRRSVRGKGRATSSSRGTTPSKQPSTPSKQPAAADLNVCPHCGMSIRTARARKAHRCFQEQALNSSVAVAAAADSSSAPSDNDDSSDGESPPPAPAARSRGRRSANRPAASRGGRQGRAPRGRSRPSRGRRQTEEQEEEEGRGSVADSLSVADELSRQSAPELESVGDELSRLSAPDAPDDHSPDRSPPQLAPVSPLKRPSEAAGPADLSEMDLDEDTTPAPVIENGAAGDDSDSKSSPTADTAADGPAEEAGPPALSADGQMDTVAGGDGPGVAESGPQDGHCEVTDKPDGVSAAGSDRTAGSDRPPSPPAAAGDQPISGQTVSKGIEPSVENGTVGTGGGVGGASGPVLEPGEEAMDATDVNMVPAERTGEQGTDGAQLVDFKGTLDAVKREPDERKSETSDMDCETDDRKTGAGDQKLKADGENPGELDQKAGILDRKSATDCDKPGSGDQKPGTPEQKPAIDEKPGVGDQKAAFDGRTIKSEAPDEITNPEPSDAIVKSEPEVNTSAPPVKSEPGESPRVKEAARADGGTGGSESSEGDGGGAADGELAVPRPVPEPEHLAPPDPDQFQLVASTFDGLRKLVDTFDPATATADTANSKKGQKQPACEVELHKALKKILEELEPLETKINQSVRRMRKRLCQEWLNYIERPADYEDPNEAAWVEPDQQPEPTPSKTEERDSEPSPEPSDDEQSVDADGRRKQRSRRAKRKRVNYCVDGAGGAAGEDAKDSETWQTSSRGRVRKVRKMDDFAYEEADDTSRDRSSPADDDDFSVAEGRPTVSPSKVARFARPAGASGDNISWESYRQKMLQREQQRKPRAAPRPARITEPSPAWNSELPILNENLGDRVSRIRSELQRKMVRRPAASGAAGAQRSTGMTSASPKTPLGGRVLVNRTNPLGGAITKVVHTAGETSPFVLRMGRDGRVFMDKVAGSPGASGSQATGSTSQASATPASSAASPAPSGNVTASKVTVVLPCKDPNTGDTMYMKLPPDQANSILQSLQLPGISSGATAVSTFTAAVAPVRPGAPGVRAPLRLTPAAAAAVGAVPAAAAAPFRAMFSAPGAQLLGSVSIPATAPLPAPAPVLLTAAAPVRAPVPAPAPAPVRAAVSTATSVPVPAPVGAPVSAPFPAPAPAPAPMPTTPPVLSRFPRSATAVTPTSSPARARLPGPPLLSPPATTQPPVSTAVQPPHRSVLMQHVQSLPVPPGSPRPTLREPPPPPPPPPPAPVAQPPVAQPPVQLPTDVASRVKAALQQAQAKGIPLEQQQARRLATNVMNEVASAPAATAPVVSAVPQQQVLVSSPRKQQAIRPLLPTTPERPAASAGRPVLLTSSPRPLMAARPTVLAAAPTLLAVSSPPVLQGGAPQTTFLTVSQPALLTSGPATLISSQPALLAAGPALAVTAAAPVVRPNAVVVSRPPAPAGRAVAGPPPMQRAPRYVSSSVQFVAAPPAAPGPAATAAASSGQRLPVPQQGKVVVIKSGNEQKLGVLMPNGQILEFSEKQANSVRMEATKHAGSGTAS
ncbi:uncharacterized protein LOC122368870 [Amphibalanus amphitrite]|uniref:uncharacterized protein LOC122368870 n=1 Tax=Amphibalanus amphitrite TaxID=1232801 RepID=UPI001C9264AB|nr:uncharacterized protein LOC122368870 [Amphibalanus amphitrite]XP_043199111.1 uncharacterized protein LOC122368870 [Amphibalanus amphitrite]